MRPSLAKTFLTFVPLVMLMVTVGPSYANGTTTGTVHGPKRAGKIVGHAYVGVSRCKMCHMPYFKAWAGTPHGKAFDALKPEKKEDKNPKCLKCHGTGSGAGGHDAAKNAPDLRGVQCEACHGAGADYAKMDVMKNRAKAKAAGLVFSMSAAVCVKCHNKESPNFKGFDYTKYLAKGVHKVEKKAPVTK
ncbi:MAG: multiheme c-type cytochrome [Candidatus Eisenbacteria bacterium]|nr:multiheme c-type cytochrome [Candidatus Eisenbacteria bacterium]